MGVDKAVLEQLAADVAGDDAELRTMILERIGGNEKAATAFAGGFMRQRDYSQKTEALASDRKKIETLATQYEERLNAAEADKRKILDDLAKQRTTTAQAEAALEAVKTAYALEDKDIPGMSDLIATRKGGKVVDSTPEFDPVKFRAELKAEMLSEIGNKLLPELSSLSSFPVIWDEISHDHEQLFGKRLTRKEREELLDGARKANNGNGMPLVEFWESKYGVGDKRLEARDAANKAKWQSEWEAEQARKRSEDALAGMHPHSPGVDDSQQSPVFRRDFKPTEPAADGKVAAPPERKSGAERAAEGYMRRRAQGIPLGQPEPKRTAA